MPAGLCSAAPSALAPTSQRRVCHIAFSKLNCFFGLSTYPIQPRCDSLTPWVPTVLHARCSTIYLASAYMSQRFKVWLTPGA